MSGRYIHSRIRLLVICFILLVLLCYIVAHSVTLCANAETVTYLWARVTEENVNLYATTHNSKVICTLEKSYYVKILETYDDMLFVSIMGNSADFPEICGYVYTDEVKLIVEDPVVPYYPTQKATVSADSASLRLSPVPSAEVVTTATNTQQLNYYGKITSYNKNWYYVYYAGKFGYVDENSVTMQSIPLHPTPLIVELPTVTVPADPNETPTPPTVDKVSPTAEILLIVFVALLAVGLILALFLPGNRKKRDNVFDQDI